MNTAVTIKIEEVDIEQLRVSLDQKIHLEIMELCSEIFVDHSIRQFLANIILESLIHRKEEWRSRGFEPDEASVDRIVSFARSSIALVLSEASLRANDRGRDHILFVDLLAAIVKYNCKIFPLCGG